MCKPSCCNNTAHDGAGIAAAAIVIGGALIAIRIGPTVARIAHIAIEALAIVTLTVATAFTCLLVGWLAVRIVRWQNRRHHLERLITLQPARFSARQHSNRTYPRDCLACRDTGTVQRAIGSRYQARLCPACQPTRWVA